MKISLVMAACNQGRYLRETVESAIKSLGRYSNYEIVIVDDFSEDGCCDGINTDKVRVIRSNRRLGCSQARRLGADNTTGDVLVLSDPHCFFPPGAIKHLAKTARYKRAIVEPRVKMEGKSRISGGQLEIQRRGLRLRRPGRTPRYPAVFGSIYAFSRCVYNWLGGWPRLPGKWGRWEATVTLLAYRLGIPVYVDKTFTCTHRMYRRRNVYPFDLPQTDIAANSHFVHCLFFPNSYDACFRPLLEAYHGPERYDDLFISNEFCRLRSILKKRAVTDEWEVAKRLFGLHDFDSLRQFTQALTGTPIYRQPEYQT